jgi:hypothetical protein
MIHGLILEVNTDELVLLDDYEDDEYELKPVYPRLMSTSLIHVPSKPEVGTFAWATHSPAAGWEHAVGMEIVAATAYIWRPEYASKLVMDISDPWTPEHFAAHERSFVNRLAGL